MHLQRQNLLFLFITAAQFFKGWPVRACRVGDKLLSDCHWCTCDQHGRYICTDDVCSVADIFGSFEDEISVAMEGHGTWRRSQPGEECETGVLYHQEATNCICTADGSWPTDQCRQVFKNLKPVRMAAGKDVSTFMGQSCEKGFHYIVGCDVCECPLDGKILPEACTKRVCDGHFVTKFEKMLRESTKPLTELYMVNVICDPGTELTLQCSDCTCIEPNKMKCKNDSCPKGLKMGEVFEETSTKDSSEIEEVDEVTTTNPHSEVVDKQLQCRPGSSVTIDCNTCFCSDSGIISSCTNKTCDNLQKEPHLDGGINVIPVPTLISINMSAKSVDPGYFPFNKKLSFDLRRLLDNSQIRSLNLVDRETAEQIPPHTTYNENPYNIMKPYQYLPAEAMMPQNNEEYQSSRYWDNVHPPSLNKRYPLEDSKYSPVVQYPKSINDEKSFAPNEFPNSFNMNYNKNMYSSMNVYPDPEMFPSEIKIQNYKNKKFSMANSIDNILLNKKYLSTLSVFKHVGKLHLKLDEIINILEEIKTNHETLSTLDVRAVALPKKDKCLPGTSFKVRCNICFCLGFFHEICTLNHC